MKNKTNLFMTLIAMFITTFATAQFTTTINSSASQTATTVANGDTIVVVVDITNSPDSGLTQIWSRSDVTETGANYDLASATTLIDTGASTVTLFIAGTFQPYDTVLVQVNYFGPVVGLGFNADTAIVIIPGPPIVTPTVVTQPVATYTATVGTSFSFNFATISGYPIPNTEIQKIGSAVIFDQAQDSILTLAITNPQYSDSGYYHGKGSNFGGVIFTDTMNLIVQGAPSISSGPTSITVNAGTNATFSVTTNFCFPVATYQWYFGITPLINGGQISGATSSTLTITGVTTGNIGSYYCVVSNGVLPNATSVSATLGVNTTPTVVTQPVATFIINVGQNLNLAFGQINGVPTPTTEIRKIGSGLIFDQATDSMLTLQITNIQYADSGRYYGKGVNIVGTIYTDTMNLIVQGAPSISSGPTSITVNAGTNATFSVTTNFCFPVATYQWYFGITPLINGGQISGATSSTLTITGVTTGNIGSYYCVVSNGVLPNATSVSATLGVNTTPTITLQPANVTVVAPNPATFTIAVTGIPTPTLQWRLNGNPISGATNTSFTIPVTSSGMNLGNYDCIVDNGIGAPVTSNVAVLTVNYGPVILTQPTSQTVLVGNTATFSVLVDANPIPTYQWYRNGLAIGGATNPTYTTLPTTIPMDLDSFVCVITNAYGSVTTITTPTPKLHVQYGPIITAQPVDLTVVSPNSAVFSVSVNANPAPSYQWRLNGNAILGATTSMYTIPLTSPSMDGYGYDVVVNNGIGAPLSSSVAVLTVYYGPSIITQPMSQIVVTPATATFTVTATGNPAVTYQWRLNGVNILGATNASYTTPPTMPLMNLGNYDCVVGNGIGAPVTSNVAVLIVNYAPIITPTHPASITQNWGTNINTSFANVAGNPAPLNTLFNVNTGAVLWFGYGSPVMMSITGLQFPDSGGWAMSSMNTYGTVYSDTMPLNVLWMQPSVLTPNIGWNPSATGGTVSQQFSGNGLGVWAIVYWKYTGSITWTDSLAPVYAGFGGLFQAVINNVAGCASIQIQILFDNTAGSIGGTTPTTLQTVSTELLVPDVANVPVTSNCYGATWIKIPYTWASNGTCSGSPVSVRAHWSVGSSLTSQTTWQYKGTGSGTDTVFFWGLNPNTTYWFQVETKNIGELYDVTYNYVVQTIDSAGPINGNITVALMSVSRLSNTTGKVQIKVT